MTNARATFLVIVLSLCSLSCAHHVVRSEPLGETPGPDPMYCLPHSLLKLHVEQKPGSDDTFTLEEVRTASGTECYGLRLRHHANRADDWTVKVDSQGLLTSIDFTTSDKTGEVLVKLAELAKHVAKAAAGFPGAELTREERRIVEIHFDPSARDAEMGVNDALEKTGYTMTIDRPAGGAVRAPSAPFSGVAYRQTRPWRFVFMRSGGGISSRTSILFHLPNDGPVAVLPLESGPLVDTKATVTFDKGVLTEIKGTRPSELLAAVNIPVEIAKTVASIPGELLTLRVEQAQGQKDIVEAQKAVLEAQKAIEELRKSPTPQDPSQEIPPP